MSQSKYAEAALLRDTYMNEFSPTFFSPSAPRNTVGLFRDLKEYAMLRNDIYAVQREFAQRLLEAEDESGAENAIDVGLTDEDDEPPAFSHDLI